MAIMDPFDQLLSTFQAIENFDRSSCLLSVYLGQKIDQNTIQGITKLFQILSGNKEATSAKVRGIITSLVNSDLLEREQERMISKTKVSFHQVSLLGENAILFILCVYLVENPLVVEWDSLSFISYMAGDSELKLVNFLINSLLQSNKQTGRVLEAFKSGKDPLKTRTSKALDLNITRTFRGKTGLITLKILEEIIWNYLNCELGISYTDLVGKFPESSITSNLKNLKPFIIEEEIGNEKYYFLSTQGILILPILAFLIKQLSIERTMLPSLLNKDVSKELNVWKVLVEQARHFFLNL